MCLQGSFGLRKGLQNPQAVAEGLFDGSGRRGAVELLVAATVIEAWVVFGPEALSSFASSCGGHATAILGMTMSVISFVVVRGSEHTVSLTSFASILKAFLLKSNIAGSS